MACKWITQETFDAVVQENMVEFDMEPEEALNEAIQQFESQGGETYLSHKSTNKISAVWKYFKISESNPCLAHCKLCSAKLSRGGSKPSSFTTSNLIKHLRLKHKNEHNEFIAVSNCRTQQPTPQQIVARREKLSRDHQRAITITEAVTQFIILDDQPLSIVENVGFRRLLNVLEPKYEIPSCHYVSDVVLPQLYDMVKKHVNNLLQEDIKEISFMTHIWTSSMSPVSVISLTAQWIDDNFTLRQVLLHAKKLQGSHTGQAIASILKEMLQTWTIPRSAVHVVVRDNARNMIKGVDDAGLPSISCVVHMLQLAVAEGLFSQHNVADAVGVGRRIVSHFNHSNLAYSRLQDIQIQLSQPVKRLQQDVQNRWNSTFYMLQSLIEQKCTIGVYASKHELPVTITANMWSLMEKLLHILAPFEELTCQLSSSDAFASDVIPAVTVLQRMLLKEADEDHTIKTMKSTLLAGFQKRFSETKQNPLYYIATLLDPRYKDRFFSHADTGRQAKLMVLLEMQTVSEETTAEVLEEPAVKKPHSEQPGTSLESVFQEIAHESTSESSAPTAASIQLEAYLGEVTLPRSDKPLKYWAINKLRFPTLAQMAQKYLSAPCSVTESERLFSTPSHILTDSKDWLLTENAEIFLFLKKNLPLVFEKNS